jgi:very-short-patch-repair endonuclease
LRDEDIRKMKAWQAAGFDVQRLPTDAVYHEPERLLALVPRTNVGPPP